MNQPKLISVRRKVMQQVEPTTIHDLSKLSYNGNDAPPHDNDTIHNVMRQDNSVSIRRALVHQQDEVHMHVYVLEPGGVIKSHYHTKNWDIFFVIEGEFEARETKNGTSARCGKHAMHLVPPGIIHEIVNASTTEPLQFLLIQSPSKGYDFVRADLPI
jgi:quercetin dioxygenase-like cupin family protein